MVERTSDKEGERNEGSGAMQVVTAFLPKYLHPATQALVVSFAQALALKLHAAERKYGYDDGWLGKDWMDECRFKLRKHLEKGDPRDVAAYCAFLWHHGASTNGQLKHSDCFDVCQIKEHKGYRSCDGSCQQAEAEISELRDGGGRTPGSSLPSAMGAPLTQVVSLIEQERDNPVYIDPLNVRGRVCNRLLDAIRALPSHEGTINAEAQQRSVLAESPGARSESSGHSTHKGDDTVLAAASAPSSTARSDFEGMAEALERARQGRTDEGKQVDFVEISGEPLLELIRMLRSASSATVATQQPVNHYMQFAIAVRGLVNGSRFDLTDSPKSLVGNLQCLVKELDSLIDATPDGRNA